MLKFWKSVLWSILILILLLLPGDNLPENRLLNIDHLDKFAHLILFGILEFLALLEGEVNSKRVKNYLKISIICILFGLFSEILQILSQSGRDADLFDFFADIMGVVLAAVVYRFRSNFIYLFSRRN